MKNKNQDYIIQNDIAPGAVLAGPGTGKTYTIVKKVVNLVVEEGLSPSRILVTTFTKKAAKELVTRIQAEFARLGKTLDTSDMPIGNFHSLALSYLSKYKDFSGEIFPRKILDTNLEGYFLEKNLDAFRKIPDFEKNFGGYEVKSIQDIFETTTNNLVDLEVLKNSENSGDRLAYQVYMTYLDLLDKNHFLNYQLILKNFYDLLSHPVFGEEIRASIDYVIVDEYQDTNYIQEEIAFKLVKDKNILVFGDDDQALYSFRGADPKNLTSFPKTCQEKLGLPGKLYSLDINYRSNQKIVDEAKAFIKQREDIREGRPKKDLQAFKDQVNDNSLVRCQAQNFENIGKILKILEGKVNYNQIAFLFPSLNYKYVKDLQTYLEGEGIKIYNKKSGNFFERQEIRALFYLLVNIFSYKPKTTRSFNKNGFLAKRQTAYKTYIREIFEDQTFLANSDFQAFIKEEEEALIEGLYLDEIFYKALGLPFFKDLLGREEDFETQRVTKNISKFIGLVVDFSSTFSRGRIYTKDRTKVQNYLIYGYLFYLFKFSSIEDGEDLEVPADFLNFMTIHQAKGLEFEVVFISSLGDHPRDNRPSLLEYYKKNPQDDLSKYRDFYRKYYTAFTRAKNLLVFLDNSEDPAISDLIRSLPRDSLLSSLDFVRKVEEGEKPILSYTTDIEVYRSCRVKYKFVRKYAFKEADRPAALFGSRVHDLVEYISYMKGRGGDFSLIEKFLVENPKYRLPVNNYLGRDFEVKKIEGDFRLARAKYLLAGKVDLVLEGDSLVDIKTGKPTEEKLLTYQGQVLLYYRLMKANGWNPQNIYLYFIEEDRLIEVEKKEADFEDLDALAEGILAGDFSEKTDNLETCKTCPMKYFCGRIE